MPPCEKCEALDVARDVARTRLADAMALFPHDMHNWRWTVYMRRMAERVGHRVQHQER